MANKPTQAQVDEQIKRLREIKPRVTHFTMLGDDNWACVEAQIRVLQQELSEGDVYDEWGDTADGGIMDAALHAAQWLAGEDDEEYPFEQEWNDLVTDNG